MEQLRFDGRTAIVTGAGRGVGRAHARLLAARGAHVVVADFGGELDGSGSSAEPADLVVKEIEAAGGTGVPAAPRWQAKTVLPPSSTRPLTPSGAWMSW